LRRLLNQNGVDPSSCYITNAVKTYDPKRDLPTAAEIREAQPGLREELELVGPNCVLVLGGEANLALNGHTGIDAWRGSILESSLIPGLKTVSAWHPANILRTFERSYILDLDIQRAIQQSRFPEIRAPERNAIIDPDITQCMEFLDAIPDGVRVTIDIECPMMGDGLYCIGIGWQKHEAL
jgi:DNA polymerase